MATISVNLSISPAKDRGLVMFEQELELEKKSSWGPLILVLALIGAIIGLVGYYAMQYKKGLPAADATAIIEQQLKIKTPEVAFRSGKVVAEGAEQPKDPHYKVLAKAGFLTTKDVNWNTNIVEITPGGEKVFADIPGMTKKKSADNTVSYEIPVATRKLIKIDSITMNNPESATVVYEWQWETNQIGNLLDLNSDNLKSYTTWDRQKLIDKYGADFYQSGPKKETISLMKTDKGWQLNNGL
jgi:hypothetical protein